MTRYRQRIAVGPDNRYVGDNFPIKRNRAHIRANGLQPALLLVGATNGFQIIIAVVEQVQNATLKVQGQTRGLLRIRLKRLITLSRNGPIGNTPRREDKDAADNRE